VVEKVPPVIVPGSAVGVAVCNWSASPGVRAPLYSATASVQLPPVSPTALAQLLLSFCATKATANAPVAVVVTVGICGSKSSTVAEKPVHNWVMVPATYPENE